MHICYFPSYRASPSCFSLPLPLLLRSHLCTPLSTNLPCEFCCVVWLCVVLTPPPTLPSLLWGKRESGALWLRWACSAMRSASNLVAKGEGGFREWVRKFKTLPRMDSIKVDGKEKEASWLKGAGDRNDGAKAVLSWLHFGFAQTVLCHLLPTIMTAQQHMWDFHDLDHGPDVLTRITGMLCLKSLLCSARNESFKVTPILI